MSVVYKCHVIGERDKVIKTYCSIILRRFDLTDVISFVEEESILITVKYDLTVFICRKDQFFYRITVVVKTEIEVRIFREYSEADVRKLFVGVISVNFENLEGGHSARAFINVAVFLFMFVRL